LKHIFLMLFAAIGLMAADATGKWTGTMTTRNDAGEEETGPALLELKQDGTKLTGSAGPGTAERYTIENGKAEDGTITFEVQSGESLMKFALKWEGDEMKGGITRERQGQTQQAKLDLKREK
jgi:hypothetical protein